MKNKKRWTPLPAAVMGDRIDDTKKKEAIVKMLLKDGVDPKAKDGKAKAPLQGCHCGGLGVGLGECLRKPKAKA